MADLDDLKDIDLDEGYHPGLMQRINDYLDGLWEDYGSIGCWLWGHHLTADGCVLCGMPLAWYQLVRHHTRHAPYLAWRMNALIIKLAARPIAKPK